MAVTQGSLFSIIIMTKKQFLFMKYLPCFRHLGKAFIYFFAFYAHNNSLRLAQYVHCRHHTAQNWQSQDLKPGRCEALQTGHSDHDGVDQQYTLNCPLMRRGSQPKLLEDTFWSDLKKFPF